MSFDLLGQIFGKDKRRQMEAQVAGLAKENFIKPVQVALPVIASRLAAAGLSAIVGAALKGGIPHDYQGASAALGAGLSAVVLAAPNAFAASGLGRAVSPQAMSVLQAAGQKISALASVPKAQRTQEIQDIATQAALAAVVEWQNRTDQFAADQLGGKVLTPDQLAGKMPLPAGFAVTDPPETTIPPGAATPVPTPVLTASAPIVSPKTQTEAK